MWVPASFITTSQNKWPVVIFIILKAGSFAIGL